jgi:hypothetical protein
VHTRAKSVSTINSYRSAIVWYYKENKLKLSDELTIELGNYLAGFKRNVADLKQKGFKSIQEGRSALTFNGYINLCKEIIHKAPEHRSSNYTQTIFAWPFVVFCWNLMARSCSVGGLMFQHLIWKEDSLVCTLPRHKGDQTGDKVVDRHVYANPLNPAICPILSLGVLILCKPFRTEGGMQQVFEGERSESRFSDILNFILINMSESTKNSLGADLKDIGTHSCRKGATTYANSMVGGPSPVQVYLRAGWSLGNVQDRYLFSGDGGDQLTGRVVSGLPITEENFSILPPHFSTETIEQIQNECWNNIIPGYINYPSSIRTTFPYLIASVIYHEDWLRTNLPQNHPLFFSR